jgi:hypothetical protein
MTQRANVETADPEHIHVEEAHVRRRPAENLLHHRECVRSLQLVSEYFPSPFVLRRSLVALPLD